MADRPTSLAPRLRPSRGQLVLAALLTVLLGALGATYAANSAAQKRYTETYARTETATNNLMYTMRETLAYVDAADRYVVGVVPRRDVQLARALLAQRLSVVGENGRSSGDIATAEYRTALQAMDSAVAQVPAGFLPDDQRERATAILLPRTEALSDAGRRLVDTNANQLHTDARASNAALLRGRLTQLVLLVATLTLGAVLLTWVAVNVRRQYYRARVALDEEGLALRDTQEELDRVSSLERGQARILELLRAQQVPPESLIVELTEHALVDLQIAQTTLDQLRDVGVRVSLDDFGTGYSSLTQLRTLPVDQIKLDRSFAAALDDGNDKQRAVVQSVVSLTNALALDLVVEGIETPVERDTLIEMGARKGQGFLFHRPMELAETVGFLGQLKTGTFSART